MKTVMTRFFTSMLFFSVISSSFAIRPDRTVPENTEDLRLGRLYLSAFYRRSLFTENSIETGFDSTALTQGGDISALYNLSGSWWVEAGFGMMNMSELTINDYRIDMKRRRKNFYPFYAGMFFFLFDTIGPGVGVNVLHAGQTYYDDNPMPYSSYTDLYLTVSGAVKLTFFSDRVMLYSAVEYGINLTPGYDRILSADELTSRYTSFKAGVGYRLL